jgi:Spondin_N
MLVPRQLLPQVLETEMNRTLMSALLAVVVSTAVIADEQRERNGPRVFEVTVTNITPGLSFTPLLIATHSSRIAFFKLGQPASAELAVLAEGGDTAPLTAALNATGEVFDSKSTAGLLMPGASVTVRVQAGGRFDKISIAGMLLPTNDSFAAVSSFDLPWDRRPVSVRAIGYDAGSEPNDERCSSIPGPVCGGEGASPAKGGEGFVHVSNGIHGDAELPRRNYDWRNPVAAVTIARVD